MSKFPELVTVEIIWKRLISIVDEMAITIEHTSFSTVVGAATDFACELMDADGEGLAHSQRTVPAFTYTMPNVTQTILEQFEIADIRPGDVFMTNDPWINAGHHPDVAVITPFFYRGKLSGFAGSVAHVADFGGTIDNQRTTECYEEGLVVPLCKLYSEGEPNEDIFRIIRSNVRFPEMVIGDVIAEVAANETGVRKAISLLEEYDIRGLRELTREIQRRSEDAMRARISGIPDGVYESEIVFDEYDRELTIRCRIIVEGDHLTVDYSGSSPGQPRGGLNACLIYTRGHTAYCLKCILLPEVPSNAGCYRPITITAPPGSILNALPPASIWRRARTGWHMHQAIYSALAPVLPDSVMSPPGLTGSLTCYGKPDGGEEMSNAWYFIGGGMGASSVADGRSCMHYPSGLAAVPVEVFESMVPIMIKEKRLRTDSSGAGRWRGGLGQIVSFEVLPGFQGECIFNIRLRQLHLPAPGILGGEPGKFAVIKWGDQPMTRDEELSQTGALRLRDGDEPLTIETAGAGGYGPPSEREKAVVLRDLREGYISLETAKTVYGMHDAESSEQSAALDRQPDA